MRAAYLSISISFLFVCSLLPPGCTSSGSWQAESESLILEAQELEQKHRLLNVKIDSLWDTTTATLAAAIPDDFPPTDREIFLKARNADHIRMFMSFKQLDTETQALVDAAGQYDAMLAGEIKTLREQKEDFEKRKMEFLRAIGEHDPEASRQYADQFHAATTGFTEQ